MTSPTEDRYEEFLSIVERWAAVDRTTAVNATTATLTTLAERLSPGEARDLAEQLPAELFAPLYTTREAERFDVDEFLRRVAAREGTDVASAEEHARAVFVALRRSVDPREFADMEAQLPQDLRRLAENAPEVRADEFVRRVAEHAGTDDDTARRATDAVLETLAERIAPGDVDDLVARLPAALHEPLLRGKRAGGTTPRMAVDTFVQRVAEREGTTLDAARRHAAAVFATLREAVGDEYFDIRAQLPAEYAPLLARS
jgi:uncharacterized protein (DUF2267 family)